MGALEDDLDYGLKIIRTANHHSHQLVDAAARWDDQACSRCRRKGGVDLSFHACDCHVIYVASSWRNDFQPGVVERLRADGHTVYDFKGEGSGWGDGAHGAGGFGWKEVDPEWQSWPQDIPRYLEALNHPRAEEGFLRDMDALRKSDVCVMVMPCGPSASMEMGWAAGAGRFVAVYIPGMREPDLMVKMADLVTNNLDEVRRQIKALPQSRPTTMESEIALWYIANGGRASIRSRIARANKEMAELMEAVSDEASNPELLEEMADVVICLTIAANGLRSSLAGEVARKLAINHLRKWQVQNDGTLKHVKGSDPRQPE